MKKCYLIIVDMYYPLIINAIKWLVVFKNLNSNPLSQLIMVQ